MIAVRLLTIASLFSLVLAGCGRSGPPPKPEGVKVSGKILLPNGSPLTGGMLTLRPESGLYGATARIQSDGTFTLQDSGSETVVPGKYQVFVRFTDPTHAGLAAAVNNRYQQSSEDGTSDVLVEFQEATEDLVIRLNR
jgi:hypothetical protein